MNDTKVNNFLYAESLAKYLQSRDWKNFVTMTTPHELTMPSARRLNERFFSRLKGYSYESRDVRGDLIQVSTAPIIPSAELFFVSEKYESKDGYHTHGLLNYDRNDLPTLCNPSEVLDECYQTAAGSYKWIAREGRTDIRKFRVSFSPYDKTKSAGKYCSKYLMKHVSDYDFLI